MLRNSMSFKINSYIENMFLLFKNMLRCGNTGGYSSENTLLELAHYIPIYSGCKGYASLCCIWVRC